MKRPPDENALLREALSAKIIECAELSITVRELREAREGSQEAYMNLASYYRAQHPQQDQRAMMAYQAVRGF